MITRDLRRAIARAVAAAGFRQAADPGLRPTGAPGQYAASVALALGADPRETAGTLAGTLAREHWIETAGVTGPGYITVTVTSEALAAVADDVIGAGPACAASDALAGVAVPAPPPGDPLAAPTWEQARAALAVRLTARLAAAAGATVAALADQERAPVARQAETDAGTRGTTSRSGGPAYLEPSGSPGTEPGTRAWHWGPHRQAAPGTVAPSGSWTGAVGHGAGGGSALGTTEPDETEVARAVAFAGRDAVTFTLARAIPGKPLRVEEEIIARHVPDNPAYAVRYAHARAASGVRWAAASSAADTIGVGEAPELSVPADEADTMAVCAVGPVRRDTGGYGGSLPRETAAFLDALSWLPERVATAARRGRPDEFARYLEDLARVTVDVLSSASHPGEGAAPGSDRLTLAKAARTGLAAGLTLLEVSAPDRL